MRYQFNRTDDGSIDVTLEDDLPLLREALVDSLGTLSAPWCAPGRPVDVLAGQTPSLQLRERMDSGNPEPFASGNATYLQLQGGRVEVEIRLRPGRQRHRRHGRPIRLARPARRVATACPGSLTRRRPSHAAAPFRPTDATSHLTLGHAANGALDQPADGRAKQAHMPAQHGWLTEVSSGACVTRASLGARPPGPVYAVGQCRHGEGATPTTAASPSLKSEVTRLH